MTTRPSATRRSLLAAAAVGPLAATMVQAGRPAAAGFPNILKPLPPSRFVDFGTNAEMRWDSVDKRRYLTSQADLFVRNHTKTPTIDASTYALRIFGNGLSQARTEAEALSFSLADLKTLPVTRITSVHECTGNGRSFFGSQQGQAGSGTAWTLGSVGTVTWEGVRLRHLLSRIGLSSTAVSIMATGLDDPFVSGGTDYGRVRRPFSVAKALDDAILAWSANGQPLLPDHGFPLRLVLPGWIGIASIKWLGSLEVATTELQSPWNTAFYRLTGGSYPADSPPLTVNPVRSAWELPWNATLAAGVTQILTGRSWSGAAPIRSVEVSFDGGATWRRTDQRQKNDPPAEPGDRGFGWTQWTTTWRPTQPGPATLMARATDTLGRTQPLVSPFNTLGYFFDAVVRHPVTVVASPRTR
ncbi:molybdopterin-dependent oxidoreductase [Nocardioides sp.]|uniref:molybdopterin-dependent oxidoreductase n=1 Tax=Nocardioides sp. TaxID=35761 RepID=UPI002718BE86|nr:molybdopterin-dependent oxidoreductase [Nocardioides sp.]MDO9456971.1 molybdopterin-dependent oxidoreductase [Nocardioides sp.]